jgi:hypothetical protein
MDIRVMRSRFPQLIPAPVRRWFATERRRSGRSRRGCFESLERRELLTATAPFGAQPDDTAEFMLGSVTVSVVLMESDAALAPHDASTEDWTPALIQATKTKIESGLDWWKQTLAATSAAMADELTFVMDYTYANQPVHTGFEPISRASGDFENPSGLARGWLWDFLARAGYNQRSDLYENMWAFNDAQRSAHGTDWAFSMFVVNATNDLDGQFMPSVGGFKLAFSYPGGQFMIVPSGRPDTTFAHETGHIFWARDEYQTTTSPDPAAYLQRRGYYDTQNWNHVNNPTPGFAQQASIMATGTAQAAAYQFHVTASSTLETIGWRDSDGDGIFDVLDVPFSLTGTGFVDAQTGDYRFVGTSAVKTLLNRNSSGLQDDITVNQIDRAQYRIDGGAWQTAAEYHTDTAKLDLHIPLPDSALHTIEIRTLDDSTGVGALVFQADTRQPASVARPGLGGFLWYDVNGNGQFDAADGRLSGWTVQLLDAAGQPLASAGRVEPDDVAEGTLLNQPSNQPQVSLTAVGDADGRVRAGPSTQASTGSRVFQSGKQDVDGLGQPFDVWTPSWTADLRQLRIDFSSPVSRVALDAIGESPTAHGRLEAYNAVGQLIGRYTTQSLGTGRSEAMVISRPTPDIDYVIASGHKHLSYDQDAATKVNFDNLRYGAPTTVLTDTQGAYAFTGLAPGTYRVRATAPYGGQVQDGGAVTLLPSGEGESPPALSAVNVASPVGMSSWRNPGNPFDVTGDGAVTPLDALTVINYINAHGVGDAVPWSSQVPLSLVDVDGSGAVSPSDVLQVINTINAVASHASKIVYVTPTVAAPAEGESPDVGSAPASGSARVSDPAATPDRRSPVNPESFGQPGGSVGRPATAWFVPSFSLAARAVASAEAPRPFASGLSARGLAEVPAEFVADREPVPLLSPHPALAAVDAYFAQADDPGDRSAKTAARSQEGRWEDALASVLDDGLLTDVGDSC